MRKIKWILIRFDSERERKNLLERQIEGKEKERVVEGECGEEEWGAVIVVATR